MPARITAKARSLVARLRNRFSQLPGSHEVQLNPEGSLRLRGDLGQGWRVIRLTVSARSSKDERARSVDGTSEYDVEFPIGDMLKGGATSLDLELTAQRGGSEPRQFRIPAPKRQRSIVLGDAVALPERTAWVYATNDGYRAVRSDIERAPKVQARVYQVSARGSKFSFRASLIARNIDISKARIEVAARASNMTHEFGFTIHDSQQDPLRKQNIHDISGVIDLAELLDHGIGLCDGYVDIVVIADAVDGTRVRGKLKIPGDVRSFRSVRPIEATVGDHTHVFVPYVTFKGSNLAFTCELYEPGAFQYMQRLRRFGPLWALVRPFAQIWLVGETPYKAQDAGFHYFAWARARHPKRKIFYVIDEECPDRPRLDGLGNVLILRSRAHILRSFLANRIATTHDAMYVLPTVDRRTLRWMRGTRVFMQHGVMGTKNMVKNYGRLAHSFHTDFVHVSSSFEREMMVNDFGYRAAQVRVTGLSRFDSLLSHLDEPPSGLLVIPTWRDWLMSAEAFEESEYLVRWRGFLEAERLQQAIAHGLNVTVILHPNMRAYVHHLDVPGVNLLSQGDVDVQSLMRSHAGMVTDFSSVGFDFAIQGRPVYYYQFDRERFIGKAGSHVNLDTDLPGTIVRHESDLLDAVLSGWEAGFVQDAQSHDRAVRLIEPATAESYCAQVHASIQSAHSWRVPFWRVRDSARSRLLYRRFRGHRLYQPIMEAMSAIGRIMPRANLIVFESNVGKAAADSPRAIYDELSARGSSAKMIWSTRSTFRTHSLATRKVVPGSPSYYWALSRASHWVNNQNFGPILRKARQTRYIQTWHGTPLKRMQFDAVSTAGRDEGYLDRVVRKTKTWSVLLSPSEYASKAFRSAFKYEGEILECGYPRNDMLVNNVDETRTRTRNGFGIASDASAILYAPTFRDDVKDGAHFAWGDAVDWPRIVQALPDKTVLLIRMHSIVRGGIEIPEDLRGRIINVSAYPETQDLLCAADVLVTDYSSVMFDYSILDRPIILHCYDLDHYRSELRGFYFDLEAQAPGALTKTDDELQAALLSAVDVSVSDPFAEARARFRAKFAPHEDGQAAKRVVDALFTSER